MIKSVSIQNFGGIETARFDCGKFNVFQGDSDNGKSTFLQALQWCIVGGNDEYLIRNGSNTAEVVLFSDNGSRIERRLTRGGTNKLFVYNRGDVAMPKPQEIINKLYNPVLFDPSSMVRMSSKELNSFVSDSIGKRIKFKPEEIKFYKLEELDLSEDPIEVINKHYKSLFEKRTEVNRNVKNMAAKMGSVPSTKVTKEEVEETDKLLLQKQIELNKALEHNAKIDISKKNQLVKDTTKQNINTLQEEINAAEIVGNLEDVENTLKEKRETLNKNKNVYDNNKKTYDTIATTLTKLDGNITCPLHPSIVCKTDLTSYKKEMETQQIELKKNIKSIFEVIQVLEKDVNDLEKKLDIAKNMKSKKLELERAKSVLQQFEIFEGEVIETESLKTDVSNLQEKLSKMKLAMELSAVSGLDDLKKRQQELDDDVKSIDDLIKNKIPDMLKIGIKGIVLNKDGIFYNELPLYRLADSIKLRLCTAILKDLYPTANLYCLDGLEKIDKENLIKTIERFIKNDDVIQYFGTLVGNININNSKCKVFDVNKFQLV